MDCSMDGTVNTQHIRFWSINAPKGNLYEKKKPIRREELSVWPDFAVMEGFWGPSSMIEI